MNLAFSLSGTTVVLSTNQESFLIYCREHFGDACSATPVDAAEVEVEARFQPATAPPPLADYADWDACSRGFRARGDSLIWWPQRRCPHLELLSRWNGGRLTCRARLIAATPPQEEAALRRDARRRAAAYRPFTFFLFYFPVLWWQAVVLRRAPLHAAAAARQDRAVLFVGAAGCGKSTLALLLSSLPGWSLLSENLCLTDGAQLWACREPTVLKHPQLAEILARADAAPDATTQGGPYFCLPQDKRCPEARAERTLFPMLAAGATARRLTPDEARRRLAFSLRNCWEMEGFYRYASAMDLHYGTDGASTAPLERLISNLPVHLYPIDPAAPLLESRGRLQEFLDLTP